MNAPVVNEARVSEHLTVSTMPDCQDSSKAKAYLVEKGIKFTEVDLSTNTDAKARLSQRGPIVTPVLERAGQTFTGFDLAKLEVWLQPNRN